MALEFSEPQSGQALSRSAVRQAAVLHGAPTKMPNYVLYCVSYLIYGQVFTCLGPMFPYFASNENRIETQYSFLYTCRAIGCMAGSVLIKIIQSKVTLHQIISVGVASMGFFGIIMCLFQGMWSKGICVFFLAIGCAFQDIALNLAVLKCFWREENSAVWLQLLHGFFGIGGLTGPYAVYLFQLKTFTVLGFLSLCAIVFYFYLQTPQAETIPLGSESQKQQQVVDSTHRPLSVTCLFLLSTAFFFTVGQQTSFGGWVSSYSVLNHFSTKEHATIYSSVYWISITAFRFVFAFVGGSASQKIQMLGIVGVLNSVVSYFIIFGINVQFGMIFMSIMYGLCNSALFPLLLTVPEEFGFKLTMNETFTFIIWSFLGEGCLAVGVGKMMGLISYNWLIYSMLVMDLIIAILSRANELQMIKQKQRLDKELTKQLLSDCEHIQMKEMVKMIE